MNAKKVGILLLVLLLVCICGCGKDGIDLSEYEMMDENMYAKVDLEEEVPTIYMYCADDEQEVQGYFFKTVLKMLIELDEDAGIRTSCCIHFTTKEDSFVFDENEYEDYDEATFMEKAPPLLVKLYLQDYHEREESKQILVEENIREKIIEPIRETYIDN